MSTDINFVPNEEQSKCIFKVNKFIENHIPFSKLLINGSAGTGKTTIIISSIINILLNQIIVNINLLNNNNNKNNNNKKANYDNLPLNIFIISAPTNKAKDVLVTKYNSYIEDHLQNILDKIIEIKFKTILTIDLITQILNSKITFLTVSQVLSIAIVINELGIEEFTKGNDKKIIDKYNKSAYLNTSIIVDECSMIDKNTSRLLELIKCPIIYIGDYCQLPPVNEELSTVFTLYDSTKDSATDSTTDNTIDINNTSNCINLKIVERCKNNVTIIANCLRDKIYDITIHFNLLKHTTPDLIIYNKKFSLWIESYINDIKKKQLQLYKSDEKNIKETNDSNIYDTMALGWTNKCCLFLNKKIRSILFNDIKNIDTHYIIKGDKLLIKTPYYKYDAHIYSSNIVYVSSFDKRKYKPINFKEWCDINITLNDLEKNKINVLEPSLDININSILDNIDTIDTIDTNDTITTPQITNEKINKNTKITKTTKNILNYFGKTVIDVKEKQDTSKILDNSDILKTEETQEKTNEKQYNLDCEEIKTFRKLFYTKHILNDIINNDLYVFTDKLSMKYNLILPGYDLHKIKNISSINMRANVYNKWHKTISAKLFGIPNDRISCKKCSFFINKFNDKMNTEKNHSSYISDFINATDNLEFDMFLCDLVSFTKNGKTVSSNIPILDMSKPSNIEALENIRNIIKNSYEIKLMLSKQDEKELNSINKSLGEEDNKTDKTTKYITLSQMFGHYMSHVITSSYLEIDYGYVLTVHKSQGSTYDNVYVEYSNILANIKEIEKLKLLYTAITRCINKLHVYY